MRDNSKRFAAGAEAPPVVAQDEETRSPLDFSVPTEIVDLPSKGRFYSEVHPLRNKDSIEIKFMTAKDEDILTSPSLLKKGIAIDRFLKNIILDGTIRVPSLLSGDKNAILVASRINGFGPEYTTKMNCPSCGTASEHTFDLNNIDVYDGNDYDDYDVTLTDRGTFIVKLPKSQFEIEVRLLTGKDESELLAKMQANKKAKVYEPNLTDQLRMIIISINGNEDRSLINRAVDALPAFDSRYLRAAYAKVQPGLDMMQDFSCNACGYEKEVEMPLTVDFFWSK
tara:strand:+ start:919 stop:1764 length:846 start_codon:yes stop_codon:yes gene_type:complete